MSQWPRSNVGVVPWVEGQPHVRNQCLVSAILESYELTRDTSGNHCQILMFAAHNVRNKGSNLDLQLLVSSKPS